MTFTTNRGPITIATDPAAPETVAAQATLAKGGYFDDTPCHRLVTSGIFVLQCGDPTGTGTGGPGYQLPDENLPAATANNYPAGTVAMANSGPGTAGSQFFIVYKDTTLPPGYTIWGKVTSGLKVVQQIADAGTKTGASDGPPKESVTIESTTVELRAPDRRSEVVVAQVVERLVQDRLGVLLRTPLLDIGQVRLVRLDLGRCRRVLLITAGGPAAARAVPRLGNRCSPQEARSALVAIGAPERDFHAGSRLATFGFAHGSRAYSAAPDRLSTCHEC